MMTHHIDCRMWETAFIPLLVNIFGTSRETAMGSYIVRSDGSLLRSVRGSPTWIWHYSMIMMMTAVYLE